MYFKSNIFGEIVKYLRQRRRLTQKDFVSNKLSQAHLSGIENNIRSQPSIHVFKEITETLEVEPWVIMELMNDANSLEYLHLQQSIDSKIKNYEYDLAKKELNDYFQATINAPEKYYQYYLYQRAIVEAYNINNWANAKKMLLTALGNKDITSKKNHSLLEIEIMINLIVIYLANEIDYIPIAQINKKALIEVEKYAKIVEENIPFLKLQNKYALLSKYYINFCYYQQFITNNTDKQLTSINTAIDYAKKVQNYYLLFKAYLTKASILAYTNDNHYLVCLNEAETLSKIINSTYATKDYLNVKKYIDTNLIKSN